MESLLVSLWSVSRLSSHIHGIPIYPKNPLLTLWQNCAFLVSLQSYFLSALVLQPSQQNAQPLQHHWRLASGHRIPCLIFTPHFQNPATTSGKGSFDRRLILIFRFKFREISNRKHRSYGAALSICALSYKFGRRSGTRDIQYLKSFTSEI